MSESELEMSEMPARLSGRATTSTDSRLCLGIGPPTSWLAGA